MSRPAAPLRDRLAVHSMPEPNSGCWLWLGATNGCGYGKISIGHSERVYAHRASYELAIGPIPAGMQLDHKCRTPSCINPDHLEPVTNAENTRRGKVSALRPPRTECFRGHSLAVHGYIDSQGHQQCRICHSVRQKRHYQSKKAHRHVQ